MKPTTIESEWLKLAQHAAEIGLACRNRPGSAAVAWDLLPQPLAAATEKSLQALRILHRLVERKPQGLLHWLVLLRFRWTTIPGRITAGILDDYLVPEATPSLRCIDCGGNFPIVLEDDDQDDEDGDPEGDANKDPLPECPCCGSRRTVRDRITRLLIREQPQTKRGTPCTSTSIVKNKTKCRGMTSTGPPAATRKKALVKVGSARPFTPTAKTSRTASIKAGKR
jgi:hypothetical protein